MNFLQNLNENSSAAVTAATDYAKEFGAEFSRTFTSQLIKAIVDLEVEKIEEQDDWTNELQLRAASLATDPIHSGTLVKRGDIVKNWKSRLFIVYNEADNFKITYQNDAGSVAKQISMTGKTVEEFDEKDQRNFNSKGIKLTPYRKEDRTWYFKCPDDNERKQWMDVFKRAQRKAKDPRDPIEAIARAMDDSLLELRFRFGAWGFYNHGTEKERLTNFAVKGLENDSQFCSRLNNASDIEKTFIRLAATKTVGTTVSAMWDIARTSADATIKTVEKTVSSNLTALLEARKTVEDQVSGILADSLTKFVATQTGSLVSPYMRDVSDPLQKAYSDAIVAFHTHFSKLISQGSLAPGKLEKTISNERSRVSYWYGPYEESYATLYKLYTTELVNMKAALPADWSPYAIHNYFRDELEMILERAVVTMGELASTVPESDLPGALSHVTGLLVHDMGLLFRETLGTLLSNILYGVAAGSLLKETGRLLAPVDEQMAVLVPIESVRSLVSIPDAAERVTENYFSGFAANVIDERANNAQSRFVATGLELGIASISIDLPQTEEN